MTWGGRCITLIAVMAGCLAFAFTVRAGAGDEVKHVYGTAPRDDAGAAAAFESMLPVLHHPRCMNCHSRGDFPRQGDDSHRHTMNVRRGPDGDGIAAVKCSTCHQNHNLEGRHTPPGAPDWHLPPTGMPMIWEGLNDRELCELFKDPKQNGGRDVDEIVEHMNTPLVLWGWNPGDYRTPVPLPQTIFLANVRQWASKGAACPGGTSAPRR
jgi:hypothetical protein